MALKFCLSINQSINKSISQSSLQTRAGAIWNFLDRSSFGQFVCTFVQAKVYASV